MTALLSAACVLAPSLSWVSTAGATVTMYGAFGGSNDLVILAPRLVGALVAVPVAVVAAMGSPARRAALWSVATLALLGQITMALEWVAAGRHVRGLGSLAVGWYVDLAVVVLGSVAIAAGAFVVVRTVRQTEPSTLRPRVGVALASVGLGAAVIWLLSREGVFMANWAWETSVPPLPVMVLAAAWVVIVVGGAGPLLSVAAVQDRAIATGIVCGWWAFLAVPWTEALANTSQIGTTLNPTMGAFWVGTAVAAIGGLALVAWIRTPAR